MTQLPPSAIRACRHVLDDMDLSKAEHAGLMLTRYFFAHKPSNKKDRQDMKETPEETVLEAASALEARSAYRAAFRRWEELLRQLGCQTLNLELASSLAIGLGNESPLEVGLRAHHTYGMPIIPGSAIKGMCRRGAEQWLSAQTEEDWHRFERNEMDQDDLFYCSELRRTQLNVLLGEADRKSCCIFWDAWYDPDSVDGKPFHRDVITVHHPKYYQKGASWPTDFDDPTPVPFLVVKPRTQFLFAIQAPDQQWGQFVESLLKSCLQNLGIGGKTNAGYGYFTDISAETQEAKQNLKNAFENLAEAGFNVRKNKR